MQITHVCARPCKAHTRQTAHGRLLNAAGKILQHLPFRGSSLVVEPPREAAKQQLQDSLERVVSAGCSNLLQTCGTQAAANSQIDYFFDLKLVLGQTSGLCHR